MQSEIITNREVNAVQIPSGDPFVLPAGTAVIITQTLGGSYTVATQSGLARISSDDADALGIDPTETSADTSAGDALPAEAHEDRELPVEDHQKGGGLPGLDEDARRRG